MGSLDQMYKLLTFCLSQFPHPLNEDNTIYLPWRAIVRIKCINICKNLRTWIIHQKSFSNNVWDILSGYYVWEMISILLKTCASPWQADRQTHTHTLHHFLCLQSLTLIPGPKPRGSGSERMLAKAPHLRYSACFISPPGNASTEHQGTRFSPCRIKQKILQPWPLATERGNWGWVQLPSQQTHSLFLPHLPLVCNIKSPMEGRG